MSKRVVVIASGETERRSLPFLLADIATEGVTVEDVRVPPRHRAIVVDVVEKIIRSVWYERVEGERPGKFVVVLDTDRSRPQDALATIRAGLLPRLRDIDAIVQLAYAQQHLEAWYFADANGLRKYLGRDLGHVDSAEPDAIQNPKLHLKNLLNTPYSSLVSRDIAAGLDAAVIAQRSPSFRGFVAAVRNGGTSRE